jgi:hypothetical protein
MHIEGSIYSLGTITYRASCKNRGKPYLNCTMTSLSTLVGVSTRIQEIENIISYIQEIRRHHFMCPGDRRYHFIPK